jgi:hypothetical protein
MGAATGTTVLHGKESLGAVHAVSVDGPRHALADAVSRRLRLCRTGGATTADAREAVSYGS